MRYSVILALIRIFWQKQQRYSIPLLVGGASTPHDAQINVFDILILAIKILDKTV
jgi:hypothetical protein